MNEDTFKRYRKNEGGLVILHNMKEELVEMPIKHKDIILSSDGYHIMFIGLMDARMVFHRGGIGLLTCCST